MKNQRHNEVLMHLVAIKLKSLRESKGITQAEAYRLSGIHLGRIESGNSILQLVPYRHYANSMIFLLRNSFMI